MDPQVSAAFGVVVGAGEVDVVVVVTSSAPDQAIVGARIDGILKPALALGRNV